MKGKGEEIKTRATFRKNHGSLVKKLGNRGKTA
jgi:hypothetical protein